jgi:hypothetical protein
MMVWKNGHCYMYFIWGSRALVEEELRKDTSDPPSSSPYALSYVYPE